jgi:hypothetical protein
MFSYGVGLPAIDSDLQQLSPFCITEFVLIEAARLAIDGDHLLAVVATVSMFIRVEEISLDSHIPSYVTCSGCIIIPATLTSHYIPEPFSFVPRGRVFGRAEGREPHMKNSRNEHARMVCWVFAS